MNRRVDIEVLLDSWPASTAPPSGLTAAVESSPSHVDILASLLFLGLWTRPPVTHGFSLSDCWAWLRYFPALATTPDLRLRDEWTTLDPHHKTVLSGDFGVGFTTWFLSQVLGFVRYSDTLWVVNSLLPDRFHLRPSARRGPTKSPDYIAQDSYGDFSVLECKGGQSSRTSLKAALDRGVRQKANLDAIGGTKIRHSLVAGLFIPQFNSSESAVLMVADPSREDVQDLFSGFSKEQIARAVVGVSYAKELAMLDLPNVANSLVRAEGSDESLAAALERDRAWIRRDPRRVVDESASVERDYRWPSAVKLAEDRTAVGIRFKGSLPADAFEAFRRKDSIAAAEEKYQQSREHTWRVKSGDMAVTMHSPLGSTFVLSILEG